VPLFAAVEDRFSASVPIAGGHISDSPMEFVCEAPEALDRYPGQSTEVVFTSVAPG
jgi:hypothetical protein